MDICEADAISIFTDFNHSSLNALRIVRHLQKLFLYYKLYSTANRTLYRTDSYCILDMMQL